MTPPHDDWNEYRQLFLADRDDNHKFQANVLKQLGDLNTGLAEIRAERRISGWITKLVVPAAVAALVTAAARFLKLP